MTRFLEGFSPKMWDERERLLRFVNVLGFDKLD